MRRLFSSSLMLTALAVLLVGTCAGCRSNQPILPQSPASAGFNTRDLIDPVAHDDANELAPPEQLVAIAERLRKDRQQKLEEQSKRKGGASSTHPNRNILCLSGGGSFSAVRPASSSAGRNAAIGRISTW